MYWSALEVIDIGNPAQPVILGTYLWPEDNRPANDIRVTGGVAYVAERNGVRLIDVSNPAQPGELSWWVTNSNALDICGSGDLFYVAVAWVGLRVFRCADPSQPPEVGSYDGVNNPRDIHANDGFVYVADLKHVLDVIDISDPTLPVLRSSWAGNDSMGFAFGIHSADSVVYVADLSVEVVGVSNPSRPVHLGTLPPPYEVAADVYVSENRAYTVGSNGLGIVDVDSPSSPRLLGRYSALHSPQHVHVSNGLAYVSDWGTGSTGLKIIDVSNPASPTLLARPLTNRVNEVYAFGGVAYVADGPEGLRILDVTTSSSPQLLGSYRTRDFAYDVHVSGGLAYVADDNAGLTVVDVSDPASPTLWGTYNTHGNARSVDIHDGLVCVGDERSGLWVLRPATLPDLVVADGYFVPSIAKPGQAVEVSLRVQNVGGSAAQPSWTHVYISTDEFLSPDDRLWISGIHAPLLNPGETFLHTENAVLPVLPSSPHHVLVQCDVIDDVLESDEQNNWTEIGVLAKPTPTGRWRLYR